MFEILVTIRNVDYDQLLGFIGIAVSIPFEGGLSSNPTGLILSPVLITLVSKGGIAFI